MSSNEIIADANLAPHPDEQRCPLQQLVLPSLDHLLARYRNEAERGEFDTGRYRCSYAVWGSGPPILMIPGLADDRESFIPLMARLSKRFRCMAYDLPTGQGDGARLRGYSHADLVADAFALLDHLKIAKGYVFGSSFGSTIALAALHQQPGRLLRGILQGGFARRPLARAEVWLAHLGRYLPGKLDRFPFRVAVLRRWHYQPFADLPPEMWEFFLSRSNSFPVAAVAHRAILIHEIDLRPILKDVRQPVLLVCGDEDPLVSPACEEVLLKGLPNAGRLELGGCGHNPLFTHPDALADVVTEFLTPP